LLHVTLNDDLAAAVDRLHAASARFA
jgi:hypothetical protein